MRGCARDCLHAVRIAWMILKQLATLQLTRPSSPASHATCWRTSSPKVIPVFRVPFAGLSRPQRHRMADAVGLRTPDAAPTHAHCRPRVARGRRPRYRRLGRLELHGHRAPPQLSPIETAADRSFAKGLTLPCGCIGTCRLGSHAGRTARGSVVGEIDNVPSESIAESITESIASTVRATPWDPSRWAALAGRAVARGWGALGWCTDP